MGIDLLLVFGLQDEDDLDRYEVVGVIANRQNQLRSSIDGKLRSILRDSPKPRLCAAMGCSAYLEDMSNGILPIDLFFHDTILIYTNCGQDIQDGLVHGLETVDN